MSEPLYNRIGSGYDNTRRADPAIAQRLAAHLPQSGEGRYLDLACGTGNYTSAVSQIVGNRWVGCDVAANMLRRARDKHPGIEWVAGEVAALPFANETFDGALCTNALHHFPNLGNAFAELRRVVAMAGKVVVFSATVEQMQRYWLNAYFPVAMARSMVGMPSTDHVLSCAREAGFALFDREPYLIQPDLQDTFLYSGKHDPVRYLNPIVRAGISTFSAHADAAEIEAGCNRLANDITSGQFANIAQSYVSTDGDYSIWSFGAAR